MSAPRIVVLGAAGLVGYFTACDLIRRGYPTTAVARRFTPAQLNHLGAAARDAAVVDLDAAGLARLLETAVVVVNCIGILQGSLNDSTRTVHETFVANLINAVRALARPVLLVHISIPGRDLEDRTAFSVSKRKAEHAIAASALPYAILRPGFVFAPAAYGGSAMLRALAVLPVDLPPQLATQPFGIIDVRDIAHTVSLLADRCRQDAGGMAIHWDLMNSTSGTLGDALAHLRQWLGAVRRRRVTLPVSLLRFGAWTGDAASWLGWRPPVRSTALAELRRGVSGDPRAWMAETSIAPSSLDDILKAQPATIGEKWFARLYLLKALAIAGLVVFWCASALIALLPAYPAAVAILTSHGYSETQAQAMTIASGTIDFLVGAAIAVRRTNRGGLWAGIAVSLFYMLAAALLTPDIWIEPLGALVKTFPAIILMLVVLAVADDR
jgi:uncharacterized protein YbjT (DUF2867 family)